MSKNFKIKNGLETTNITASANISSSGTIISNNLTIDAVTGISSILNTGLKIGRDSTDLIDFATADNVIGFRVGDNDEMKLTTTALHPASNNGSALGLANRQWSDLFLAQGAVLNFDGGDTTLTDNGASLDIAGDDFKGINISGHITASGNISASGTITMLTASIGGGIFTSASLAAGGGGGAVSAVANGSNNRVATFSSGDALNGEANLLFDGSTLSITGNQTISSHITASGNISASGNILTNGNITAVGTITAEQITSTDDMLVTDDLEVQGNISGSSASTLTIGGNTTIGGDLDLTGKSSFTGNITASSNISASGTIQSTGNITTAGTLTAEQITSTDDMLVTDDLEVRGNISGSSTSTLSIGGQSTLGGINSTTHITASGNISSSGIITAEGLVISDDALITDDLEIQGNISGSSASTLTIGGVITAEGLSITDDALITDDLEVRGNISGSSASTLTIGGNTTVGGDLDLAGKSSFTGNITASGNISASGTLIANAITLPDNAISGDKVEGGTIASITISQLGGALDVNNENITNIDVNSGTIDGTVIGGGSAAAGTFTTLNATSLNVTSITSSIVTSSILKTEGSNIFGDTAADTHTFNGGIIAGNITSSGKISSSGGFIGGLTGTADVATVATTVTITDNESTNESNAVVFTAGGDVDGGNLGLESDGNLTYNPSTGRLTATQLAGTLQTAAQGNVTSLGTLTTLTVDDITINASKIEDAGALEIEAGGDFHLDGAGEILLDSATSRIRALGNITASNNISASGTIISNDITADAVTGVSSILNTGLVIGRDSDNQINFGTDNVMIFKINNSNELRLNATALRPHTNNGLALGSTSTSWSDLYLAEGGFITFDNGDVVLTQTGPEIELSGSGATRLNVEGNITASGNISASGTVFADSFQSATGGSGIDFNDSLDLTGNITASGNISSSGTLDITGNVNFDGDLDVDGTTNLDVVDIDGAVNMASTLLVSSHITASTNISASGTITAGTLDADAVTDGLAAVIVAEIDNDEIPIAKLAEDAVTVTAGTGLTGGGSVTLGGTTTVNVIGGTGVTANANDVAIGQDVATTANVTFNHITSSGNISASGNLSVTGDLDLDGKSSFTGNITASTNISASGTITAGTLDADAITDGLAGVIVAEIDNDEIPIAKLAEDAVTVTAGTNLSGGGSITLGGSATLNVDDAFLKNDADDTTSGVVTAGGFITSNGISAQHITASGNISASGNILTNGNITAVGTITAEQVTSTDDMNVTDDLIVGGNISGSSTSTGSFGELKVIDDVTISDRLTVGGVANFSGTFVNIGGGFGSTGVSIAADGDISTNGTLTIDGAISASSNISASGTITANAINVNGTDVLTSVSGNTFATDLKIGRDADNLIDFTTDNQIQFRVNAGNELKLNNAHLFPAANDGHSLGAAGLAFSDLFLADGAVINFNNGEINLTQTDAALVMSGSGATTLEVLGNVSGSLTSTGSFGVGFFDNKVGIGTTSPGQHLEVVGNISASGTLLSNNINVSNKIVHTADANTEIAFAGDKITITAGGLDMITLTEDTSDQIVFGDARTKFAGNITASANISASGIITAEGLVISDDALITDDLEVRGNTSGSSTSTGSFGNIVGNSISLPNNSISGDVVEGGTIAAITITDLTTTTLNVTHLTSSFVTSSTIITEGSNIFGDAAADTHTFNGGIIAGNITASGDISASGTIIAEQLTTSDDLTVGDDIFLSDSIVHSGDTDTNIAFTDDQITFKAGDVEMIRLVQGSNNSVVVNDTSADIDFRVESNNNVNMLRVVGSSDKVGIGTGEPSKELTVAGDISSSGDLFVDDIAQVQHITASGNISSSGTLTVGSFSTDTMALTHLTASGNISASNVIATSVDINGGTINGITDLAVADGGTGASTLTDGGVLLGSGTGAITAMAVLTDGQMIVGDGTTDPVPESGATLRTSIGVGAANNVIFNHITSSGNISSSGTLDVTGNVNFDGNLDVDGTSNLDNVDIDGVVDMASRLTIAGHITSSNNISSSGTLDVTGNVNFDGDLDVDGTTNLDVVDIDGAVNMASTLIVSSHITASGVISSSGGFIGDLTGTADVATVATTVTITDNESTNETNAIVFTAGGDVDGGNIGLESDGTLNYNPSTGRITATQLAGTLQTAAQGNVTSLGTLTTLTVDDITINASKIEDAGALEIESGGDFHLDGAGEILLDSATSRIRALGNITASGNISASGAFSKFGSAVAINEAAVGQLTTSIAPLFVAGDDGISLRGTGGSVHTQIRRETGTGGVKLVRVGNTNGADVGGEYLSIPYSNAGGSAIMAYDGCFSAGNHITASGNISASGTLTVGSFTLDNLTTGNITASGNISSSGNITSTLTGSFGGIKLNDTKRIQLGTSNDLQIFHDGSNSNINDSGTGALNINGSVVRVRDISDGNTIAQFTDGAGTLLKHNNSTKFETSTTGINVTGHISASSHITASGNISSSGIITGEGLVISDDALITDDLEVQGNISGSSASTITIGGKLQAGSKSFLINKPEGGKLEYGVLEGQQNDVFYRGELKGDNVIHLPQEWEWLVDENTITIQLTSIGKHQELYIKEIKENKIFIDINGVFKTKENIHCYHVIHGTRKDIELIRNHQ